MMNFIVVICNDENKEEFEFDFKTDLKKALRVAKPFVEDSKYRVIIIPTLSVEEKQNGKRRNQ